MAFSILIKNIKELVTLKDDSNSPRCGTEMENLSIIESGAIGIEGEKISWEERWNRQRDG